MRVLLVTHHAPPHIGGVEQVVWVEAQSLLAAGHTVIWITSDGIGAGEPLPQAPRLRVIRVPACHVLERRMGTAYPFFSPELLAVVWREVGRADLVHVHGLVFQGSVLAALFARLRHRRCLLTDHGGILRYRSRLATWALRLLIETAGRLTARCAHRLIAINPEIERLLVRLSGRPDRVVWLTNPLPNGRFAPPTAAERRAARAALGWDDRPRVLFVGRMLPHKGIEVLLDAADPAVALAFCGPGDQRLIARIQDAGAQYLPPRPHRELVTLYHAADLLALPSRNEGSPLVVQEALACGLPVVMSDPDAYQPYRLLPGLRLCNPTAADLRTAIADAMTAPPRSAAGPRECGPKADVWLTKLLAGIA